MNKNNQNKPDEIDLLELLQVLLEHIWIIITVSLFAGLIALCVALFYLPTMYQSSTLLYVKSVSTKSMEEQTIDSGDLKTAQSLLSTYMTVLKIDTVMEETCKILFRIFFGNIV